MVYSENIGKFLLAGYMGRGTNSTTICQEGLVGGTYSFDEKYRMNVVLDAFFNLTLDKNRSLRSFS